MQEPILQQLMDALRCLPGVGPKSSQRMAFHLLERDRQGAFHLAESLAEAVDKIGHCHTCQTLSSMVECALCSDQRRDKQLLCVVETPADVMALESATSFKGLYFVLNGRLSPLDGLGPADIGLDKLAERIKEGELTEIILATNPTVEGEATAHYIAEMAKKHSVRATRIAHGVPLGGELEYIDGGTLSHAFSGRGDVYK
ncbi:MAG: recombination protein RecR [Piscirickettsiaceae bacterium]|nr:MAG: recombination protein RecR [Piscirickettsiaceae bacterium]PCI70962.1 MAG: recombination protein RecR [Piscirickettsiaceae bacterium]